MEYTLMPKNCEIRTVSNPEAIIDWVSGIGPRPEDVNVASHSWLLAVGDEGITWGRKKGDTWLLSCNEFPQVSPVIEKNHLHWLRIFDEKSEILVWNDDGELRGRILSDRPDSDSPKWVKPDDERILLMGTRVDSVSSNGFSLLYSTNGSRHAVPLRLKDNCDLSKGERPRLIVRHYFGVNDNTGEVKRVLTRLVDLRGDHNA